MLHVDKPTSSLAQTTMESSVPNAIQQPLQIGKIHNVYEGYLSGVLCDPLQPETKKHPTVLVSVGSLKLV